METHILHKFEDENLYGQLLKIAILGYLRPEMDFESLDGLIKQIHDDIKNAETLLDQPNLAKYRTHEFFNNWPRILNSKNCIPICNLFSYNFISCNYAGRGFYAVLIKYALRDFIVNMFTSVALSEECCILIKWVIKWHVLKYKMCLSCWYEGVMRMISMSNLRIEKIDRDLNWSKSRSTEKHYNNPSYCIENIEVIQRHYILSGGILERIVLLRTPWK